MGGVTALVTCCKRLHNVERIWAALRAQSHPCDDVWFFYNGKETLSRGDLPPFGRFIRSDESDDHYTRFAVGLATSHEWLFVLDDDCVPGERWVEHCLETAKQCDGIFAPAGFRVSRPDFETGSYGADDEVGVIKRPSRHRALEVDVPYHSYFLRRRHLASMFRAPVGLGLRGGGVVPICGQEDVMLACRAWVAGRVGVWLPSRPDRGSEGAGEEVADRVHACSLNRPLFSQDRLASLRYEASLGWRPRIARGARCQR